MAKTVPSAQDVDLPARPWEHLPPEVAEVVRPHIPAVSEEIIQAIRRGVPAYAHPLEGAFGRAVRGGVEQALEQFAQLIGGEGGELRERAIYAELGRGEARAGRTLESLLAAYRLGARVSWHRVVERLDTAELGADALALLAESIFAYIDELSALSAEGYAEEQSASASERERARQALVGLLIQSPPVERPALEEAARLAHWELPHSLAILVFAERRDAGAPRLPFGSLAARLEDTGVWCAAVVDPTGPGRAAELEAAVEGRLAALGPTVPAADAWRSARRALEAHRLGRAGVLPDGGLIHAEDHLAELIVHAEPGLMDELRERRLEPLAGRSEGSRERLAETLRAWLEHQGNVPAVAEALHVHPQTVRYRLGQLREAFGESLDDPGARFELLLALRSAPPPESPG